MPRILSLTGSSGTGKTTIAKAIIKDLPQARMVLSYTTRKPRPTDLPGEYEYLTDTAFGSMNAASFLWTAERPGVRFGTVSDSIREILEDDKAVGIMILVPEAVQKLRDYLTSIEKLSAHVPVFIASSPKETLLERLRQRDNAVQDTERRLIEAPWEERARSGVVPFHFIQNDGDINTAVRAVIALLSSQRD